MCYARDVHARGTPTARRRPAPLLAGLALALTVVVAAPARPARAAEGLTAEATTTYRVDAVAGVVEVRIDLRLTNTVADRTTGDGVVQTTFTGISVPLQPGAQDVSVSGAGATPTLDVVPQERGVLAEIRLAEPLTSGRSTSLSLTHVLRGAEPRSTDPTRVNRAFQAFPVWVTGDPGLGSVRVELPAGREIVVDGAPLQRRVEGGTEVLTSGPVEDPASFVSFVTVRDRAALDPVPFQVRGHRFTLEAWPGDLTWATFVQDVVTRGLPVLEEMMGSPWPRQGETRIAQTTTFLLEGYDGSFDERAGRLELDEALDTDLVLHELSHAWLGESLFDRRWMFEGFAQELASRGAGAIGAAPPELPAVSPDAPGAISLDRWTFSADDSVARERYGYDASWTVARALADEIGGERVTAVLAAAQRGTNPYDPDDPDDLTAGTPVGWRRLLDLLEDVGGARSAEQLLRTWVLAPDQVGELEHRRAARTAYATVTDDAAAWRFEDVASHVSAARRVLDERDAVTAAATVAGLTVPVDEQRYEQADDPAELDVILTELEASASAIDRYITADAAVQADEGLLTRIGLIGEDPAAPLEQARRHLAEGRPAEAERAADAAIAAMDQAEDTGRTRVVLAGSAAALLVVAGSGVLVRRSARRRRVTQAPPAWPDPAPDPARVPD